MRYSYEYKRKCIELYREGKWPDTPSGLSDKQFRHTVRKWFRMEEACGPEALQRKNSNRVWTPEEKLTLIQQVLTGKSNKSVAIEGGIDDSLLYQWVQKYKIYGYNGLVDKKKGRPPKEPHMKHKKVNFNNPRSLVESELEELIRLRAENEYIKAENEVIKKEIALREEKQAALLKAKKQQSSENSEKKDTN
ncbi:helix-turn-helix domain-containing protein [[Clostridium] hylemonae]|uniref:helix-turn-helix domain-containing protein n=1 Tax=[Clostridium] hylemonae TaxID=89153 RepID=UPI00148629F3|nr:helix-turn-helix domain-containing protein [[Clostridium] hylemonae]